MTKFFLGLFCTLAMVSAAHAQLARATFVNNSADKSVRAVDIYVLQSGVPSKVEDVPFQQANNMDAVALFGGLPASITIVRAEDTDQSNVLAFENFTPEPDKAYVIIYSGVVNKEGVADNPDGRDISTGIIIKEVSTSIPNPTKLGVYVSHGATDLKMGDFYVKGQTTPFANDIAFRDISNTIATLDRNRVTLEYTEPTDRSKVIAAFDADLSTLNSPVALFALSGYLDAPNSNSTDTLALLIIGEDGSVVKRPVLSGSQTCSVQFIHAAADPKLNQVDVYVNGVKDPALDNFSFRAATNFTTQASGVPVTFAFTSPTAASAANPIATLTIGALRLGKSYQIVFTGVTDTLFAKNPENIPIAFDAVVSENALTSAPSQPNSFIRTGHFVTDAPTVSVSSNTNSYAPTLSYKQLTAEYVSVTPAIDTLWVRNKTTGSIIKGYVTDLRGNIATTFLLTGFVASDSSNKQGQALRPILVNANGNVNATLQAVDSLPTGISDIVPSSSWRVAPLPSSANIYISFPTSPLFNNSGVTATVISTSGTVMLTQEMMLEGAMVSAHLQTGSLPAGTYTVAAQDMLGRYLGSVQIVVIH